jgi:methylenetetrahydrofolate dehydrogenase (NADP+)/methenyltetrahydrofolate cyclohydrolase
MIIDGSEIAQKILKELQKLPVPQKEFAAVLVGDDQASLSFLKQKEKTAESLGVKFKLYRFEDSLAESELIERIAKISSNDQVGAIIIQLPLPPKFNRVAVLNAIGIEKDVDVLNGETSKVLAPAAGALKRILETIKFDIADKQVVVVGSGILIGRPIVDWLMSQVKHLTVVNRGGYDPQLIRTADVVVAGAGVPRLIRGEHIKHGAVIVDFGYGRDEADELAGDVDFKSVQRVAGYVTPTPGGTGPVVVAQLFWNFYHL